MTANGKKKLDLAVAMLRRFHFKENDIMIGGSLALDMMGVLPENREVDDVDVFLKMDHDTWGYMKLLGAIGDDNHDNDDNYPENKSLKFDLKDLTLNIWKTDDFGSSTMVDDEYGVHIASVMDILEKKKEYGRNKDLWDLINITKLILK